jgi:hypothetical protein
LRRKTRRKVGYCINKSDKIEAGNPGKSRSGRMGIFWSMIRKSMPSGYDPMGGTGFPKKHAQTKS